MNNVRRSEGDRTSLYSHRVQRTDDFVNLVAIVGVLNLSLIGKVGTEYGNLPFYGVTDPLWIGVLNEFLFSTCYFLQWTSVLDALASRFYSVQNDVPCQLSSVYLLAGAWAIYMVLLFFMDHAYWFNLYIVTVEFDLQVGNTPMYIADTLPTIAFAAGLPLWILCSVRARHARLVWQHGPKQRACNSQHGFTSGRSLTPLGYATVINR